MSIQFSHDKSPYHPPSPELTNVDIALVLGGGGARGVAHVGVLEELLKAGIRPDFIVGCSAGAMVGALYADSLDIDYVKATVLGTRFKNINNDNKLERHLCSKIKARNFKDLQMPFIAVATNLQFGDTTAFGTGPLIPALRASAACPGAFSPVQVSGQYFIDGVVADPVPVVAAKKYNPKVIIAVDIGEELTKRKPNHVFGLIERSIEISYIHLSDMAAQKADVVIEFPFHDIGTYNDNLNEYLYQEGRKATVLKLDEIRALIKEKIPQ